MAVFVKYGGKSRILDLTVIIVSFQEEQKMRLRCAKSHWDLCYETDLLGTQEHFSHLPLLLVQFANTATSNGWIGALSTRCGGGARVIYRC